MTNCVKSVLEPIETAFKATLEPTSQMALFVVQDGGDAQKTHGQHDTGDEDIAKADNLLADAKLRAAQIMNSKIMFRTRDGNCDVAKLVNDLIKGKSDSELKGPMMVVYDPKVSKPTKCHAAHNPYLRFPPLSIPDLTTWAKALDVVMVEGKDFVVVFGGRRDVSKASEIHKLVSATLKWSYSVITLLHDHKRMKSYGYMSRKTGLASSATTELMYVGWKGKLPEVPLVHEFVADLVRLHG